mgnify:CR=1 FL=1
MMEIIYAFYYCILLFDKEYNTVNNILDNFITVENYVIEIYHNNIGTDEILLKIATTTPTDVFLQEVKDHFRAKLRVIPKIEFHSKNEIQKLQFPKMSRKPIKVFDRRDS